MLWRWLPAGCCDSSVWHCSTLFVADCSCCHACEGQACVGIWAAGIKMEHVLPSSWHVCS